MRRSSARQALKALGDLDYEYREGLRAEPPAGAATSARAEAPDAPPPTFSQAAEAAAVLWERRKFNSWRAGGRLRPDGTLRCSPRPDKPWTLERVARALPESNEWDHLAALILLDGVVRRRFMDSMRNIREVVEGIADERVKQALLNPEAAEPIRALIRDEVGAMFGELLGALKRGAPQAPGPMAQKHQRTCSKCGVKGHTLKTCKAAGPLAPDKWACIHCTNQAGMPLAEPMTHPVPPNEFHKDDPSYDEAEAAA